MKRKYYENKRNKTSNKAVNDIGDLLVEVWSNIDDYEIERK